MTIREALNLRTDSEILLAHVLKKDKTWLFANPDCNLSRLQTTNYKLLTTRRSHGVPIPYLTGHKEFYGLDFKVNSSVLIPRPETELLVERTIEILQTTNYSLPTTLIDVGTGSGCVIVTLAVILRRTRRRIPRFLGVPRNDIKFYATDFSPKALTVARANARRHGVVGKIRFLPGNLLDPLLHLPLTISTGLKVTLSRTERVMRGRKSRGHSLILANLPYLTPKQVKSNPDLAHEPRSALIGGRDGLKYYRELFRQIKAIRHSEGTPEESQRSFVGIPPQDDNKMTTLLEHDPRQKNKLAALAKKYFPAAKFQFHKDLFRRYRVMEIQIV